MITSWLVDFACVALLVSSTVRADQQSHNTDSGQGSAAEEMQVASHDRRPFDRTGAFQRRAFDRIGGFGGLGGLQKRRLDQIDSWSSPLGYAKRSDTDAVDVSAAEGDMNDGDRVSRPFADVDFDKSAADQSFLGGHQKRPFDRIGASSSLGGLQRRAFDRIGSASSLDGLSKRSFDGVSPMSSMSGFREKKMAAADYEG